MPPGTHRLEATLADAQEERAESQGRRRCEVTQQVEVARGQALPVPTMTREKFEQAKRIYFDRCTGRYGVFRKGATEPPRLPGDMRGAEG